MPTNAVAVTATTDGAGFYGKLPIRGDFVVRNLPPDLVQSWDAWLQSTLAASRQQLHADWLRYYLNSPLWRFALSAGVCANDVPYAGVLMPSVDRVGRYYPLMIATALPARQSLLELVIDKEADAWFSQTEHVILMGLDDNLDLDAFTDAVQNLRRPLPASPMLPPAPAAETRRSAWHCQVTDWQTWQSALLLEPLLQRGFDRYSLWWTAGSEHIKPCLNICTQLPTHDGFAALLAGDWQQRGWASIPLDNTALLSREVLIP